MLILCFGAVSAYGQTLPSFGGLKGSPIPVGNLNLPKEANLQTLPSGLEIPYQKELRQIQQLKQSYDSLRGELKDVRESLKDSTTVDSLLSQAKLQSKIILDKESKLLEELITDQQIPSEQMKAAATRTLEVVKTSQTKLEGVKDINGIESLLDQNEENLKALTNEWLMPKVEELVLGTVPENLDPSKVSFPDFYGKGALEKFGKEGLDSQSLLSEAKSQARGKAKHISDEYLRDFQGKYSKLKLDSLGDIQVIQQVKEKKFKLFEENKLKGESVFGRTGVFAWYDPLSPFGKGLFAEGGISYDFTHQFSMRLGAIYKSSSTKMEGPQKDGQGLKLGMRFMIPVGQVRSWGIQASLARETMEIKYPAGYESLDFSGQLWSGSVGIVKEIPIGGHFRSVIVTSWNPWFDESRNLGSSAIQLKIGFEVFKLKGIKREIDSKVKLEDFEKKAGKYVEENGELNF